MPAVLGRSVGLRPDQWEWLSGQGSVSSALRKVVDRAMQDNLPPLPRSVDSLEDAAGRFVDVHAAIRALETEAKELRTVLLDALDAGGVDALDAGRHRVTRSWRRSLKNEAAVALLESKGLPYCIKVVREADVKAAEAAVTLGQLDGADWNSCFARTPVIAVRTV